MRPRQAPPAGVRCEPGATWRATPARCAIRGRGRSRRSAGRTPSCGQSEIGHARRSRTAGSSIRVPAAGRARRVPVADGAFNALAQGARGLLGGSPPGAPPASSASIWRPWNRRDAVAPGPNRQRRLRDLGPVQHHRVSGRMRSNAAEQQAAAHGRPAWPCAAPNPISARSGCQSTSGRVSDITRLVADRQSSTRRGAGAAQQRHGGRPRKPAMIGAPHPCTGDFNADLQRHAASAASRRSAANSGSDRMAAHRQVQMQGTGWAGSAPAVGETAWR